MRYSTKIPNSFLAKSTKIPNFHHFQRIDWRNYAFICIFTTLYAKACNFAVVVLYSEHRVGGGGPPRARVRQRGARSALATCPVPAAIAAGAMMKGGARGKNPSPSTRRDRAGHRTRAKQAVRPYKGRDYNPLLQ
jgi:hypothetical protein